MLSVCKMSVDFLCGSFVGNTHITIVNKSKTLMSAILISMAERSEYKIRVLVEKVHFPKMEKFDTALRKLCFLEKKTGSCSLMRILVLSVLLDD